MTTFDNREKAEENKYVHDKEKEFKISAKYHKLLAAWVAMETRMDPIETEAYQSDLITFDIGKNDETVLFHKVKNDLLVRNIHLSDHDIQQKMHDLLMTMKEQA